MYMYDTYLLWEPQGNVYGHIPIALDTRLDMHWHIHRCIYMCTCDLDVNTVKCVEQRHKVRVGEHWYKWHTYHLDPLNTADDVTCIYYYIRSLT